MCKTFIGPLKKLKYVFAQVFPGYYIAGNDFYGIFGLILFFGIIKIASEVQKLDRFQVEMFKISEMGSRIGGWSEMYRKPFTNACENNEIERYCEENQERASRGKRTFNLKIDFGP